MIWPGANHKSTNTRVIINYIKYGLYNDTYQTNADDGWGVTTYTGENGYKHLPFVVPSASSDAVNYSYDDGASETVRYHFTANKTQSTAGKVASICADESGIFALRVC